MRKIRVTAIAALVLALLACIIWAVLAPGESEPVYRGKKLSYWLQDIVTTPGGNTNSAQSRLDQTAIREIGTNALPPLLKWISAKDNPLKAKLIKWKDKYPLLPYRLQSAADKQSQATIGLEILGPSQASPAVPVMVELVKNGQGERFWNYVGLTFPMWALAALDHDAAVRAGIQFKTNGLMSGWTAPPAATNK